jgi:hypothetical protein
MPEANDSDIEKLEDEYEAECEQLELMFPDAKFTISMGIDELEDVITDQPHIVIKQSYDCYCHDEHPKGHNYFYISGEKMTMKFIIQELIKQGFELDCNHHFFEGLHKTVRSDVQFEICNGS